MGVSPEAIMESCTFFWIFFGDVCLNSCYQTYLVGGFNPSEKY